MKNAFPVVEIFGPTIQGEGELIGVPTMFVRFGGCDYRCRWCDTLYAVLPNEVKKNTTLMTVEGIMFQLLRQGQRTSWVTLSGGNPCLYDLSELTNRLHEEGFFINVETQGSVYKAWVADCDLLTVSPKPPSSGMNTDFSVLNRFLAHENAILKVPVFDDEDFEYAKDLRQRYLGIPMYLQVGNSEPSETTSEELLRRLDWLVQKTLSDEEMFDVAVLPQLHVLLWGNKRGI